MDLVEVNNSGVYSSVFRSELHLRIISHEHFVGSKQKLQADKSYYRYDRNMLRRKINVFRSFFLMLK